jgi:hypothetical protein
LAGQPLPDKCNTVDSELSDLASKVSNLEAEAHLLEDEYKKDLLDHDKVLLCSYPTYRIRFAQDLTYYTVLQNLFVPVFMKPSSTKNYQNLVCMLRR